MFLLIAMHVKLGKSKTFPIPHSTPHGKACFDLIHSDVWGIAPHITHGSYEYFVTFIDDFSRFTWIYLLYSKSVVLAAFKIFVTYVKNQFSKCIKILRSDSEGGEYLSNAFQQFLQEKRIVSQFTTDMSVHSATEWGC